MTNFPRWKRAVTVLKQKDLDIKHFQNKLDTHIKNFLQENYLFITLKKKYIQSVEIKGKSQFVLK